MFESLYEDEYNDAYNESDVVIEYAAHIRSRTPLRLGSAELI